MEEEYTLELENYIKNNNLKEALELLELMKLEKINVAKYEKQILFINNSNKSNLDNAVNKMENISNRLKYAKELVDDMELRGQNILETLNDNNEKITHIKNKVISVDKNLFQANVITKKMLSIFNRY